MSGMKNLANAIANDKSFAKTAGMSTKEAAEFVPMTKGDGQPRPKGVTYPAPKTRSY